MASNQRPLVEQLKTLAEQFVQEHMDDKGKYEVLLIETAMNKAALLALEFSNENAFERMLHGSRDN